MSSPWSAAIRAATGVALPSPFPVGAAGPAAGLAAVASAGGLTVPPAAPSPASMRHTTVPTATVSSPASAGGSGATQPAPSSGRPDKVMVIAEENHTYHQIFGSGRAPFLTQLATQYASITGMDAGYPPSCPRRS